MSELTAALAGAALVDERAAFEAFVQFLFGVVVFWSHIMVNVIKRYNRAPNILYRVYVMARTE